MEGRLQLAVLLLAAVLTITQGAIDADEIKDLPGLHVKPPFKQYSGYLPATGTKKLHYWYIVFSLFTVQYTLIT